MSRIEPGLQAAPPHAAETLEVRDVSVRFDLNGGGWPWAERRFVHAVNEVSLSVRRGEMFGIAGESGCGKSTLARVLTRLVDPSEGDVLLDGKPVASIPSLVFRQAVQMVFQDPYTSLNPRRKAGEIIGESLLVHRRGSRAERQDRAVAMMQRVGLAPEHFDRFPHEFSGGQRQRIAIARALILNPDFLVLDEPTSALDVSVQALVLELIQELQRDLHLGCIFITHDLNLLGYLTDRLAVMYLGRVMEVGDTAEIFAAPLHPYTRALLAATPNPDPDVQRVRVSLEGEIPSNVRPPSGCPFHTRCPSHMGRICDEELPALRRHEGRLVRCHLYAGEAAPSPEAGIAAEAVS